MTKNRSYFPAPGKQTKWSLSDPLITQACYQLSNSIIDLTASPAPAQPSIHMESISANWEKR